jgi:predicted PurR-regulated permease PerM
MLTVTDSPPWGLITKALVATAALVLLALVVWRFQFLLTPLTVAAIVAYLANPIVRWLERKTRIKRSTAVLIIYAILVAIVGGLSVVLGLAAIEQTVRLWRLLPNLVPQTVAWAEAAADDLTKVVWTIGPYELEFGTLVDLVDWDAISADLRRPLQTAAGRSGLWLASLAQGTLATLGQALLIVVVSIYLAIDAPRFGQAVSDLAHQPGYRRDADLLMGRTLKIWNAYLRGQVILAIVIWAVVSVTLAALGVNNALALGALSGVLEFLPILGAVIGTAAAVLVALLQNSNPFGMAPWLYALVILGVMIAIQQLENNLLVPRIVGDALDLHPIAVMVGVLMGGSLAGLLGAVLAAPVLATIKLYGTYAWRKMLDFPPFEEPAPGEQEGEPASLMGSVAGIFGSKTQKR